MTFMKAVDPRTELPRGENFVAVLRALKAFVTKDPMARLTVNELQAAYQLWKKELRAIMELQYEDEVAPQPLVDVPTLERNLRASIGIFEKLLTKNGKANDVQQILSRSKTADVTQLTQTLLDVSKTVEVASVEAFAKEIRTELNKLVLARSRVADGGHAAFDKEVSAAARKLWISLDTGYDVLGICLRKAGVSYDATYAGRPTTKTTLRPVLANVPPGTKVPPRKHKKAAATAAGTQAPAATPS